MSTFEYELTKNKIGILSEMFFIIKKRFEKKFLTLELEQFISVREPFRSFKITLKKDKNPTILHEREFVLDNGVIIYIYFYNSFEYEYLKYENKTLEYLKKTMTKELK
jgi:hypothetical protein